MSSENRELRKKGFKPQFLSEYFVSKYFDILDLKTKTRRAIILDMTREEQYGFDCSSTS